MKIRLLIIFTIGIIGFIGTVSAIPPFDSQDIFDFSHTIVVGKIISVNSTFSPTHDLYHIQIEKSLKNPQDSKFIIASGPNTESLRSGNQVFHVGDRALFFLTSDYVGYDQYSDILSIHPTTQFVESGWDECNIFKKNISSEHWIFGGSGPHVKAYQENKTRDFVTGKEILITQDIYNHTPFEKKINFGMTITNIDDPDPLHGFSEITSSVLDPCTPHHTLTWIFTPQTAGSYRFEFDNLMGSRHTLGIQIKSDMFSKVSVLSPLKQIKSGILIENIHCRESLVLMTKHDGSPTCVTQSTSPKLFDRGWNYISESIEWKKENKTSAFLTNYPRVDQNDIYCWTEWYLENTAINKSELISSIQKTIAEFGAYVDVPEREITVFNNKGETVISVAGIWTKDQTQHKELTSIVKKHMNDSKVIRDDVVLCT